MGLDTNITLAKAFDRSEIAFCIIEVILDDAGEPCDWRFVYLNDALAKLEGVSKEKILNHRFFEIFPQANTKWFQYYYPAAYENKSFTFEDISEEIGTYIRIHCFPVATGYCGCVLTDIKELYDSMKRKSEAYSVIRGLANNYEAVWLVKAPNMTMQLYRDDEFIYNGADGEKTMLYEKAVARYIRLWVHPEDQERIAKEASLSMVQRALRENGGYEIHFRKLLNGEAVYFQATVIPVADSEDSFVMAIRNVNEIVKEQQQQKLALQTALASARRANTAKTTFLSNMSHDIRTPMNAIMGYTKLAQTHIGEGERVQDYLDKIELSGNHLLSLINDILEMSRIESGKIYLETVECSLSELLREVSSIIQGDFKKKNISYFVDSEEIIDEFVICDKLRLKQILLNLLGNALKFTPIGGMVGVKVIQKPGKTKDFFTYEFQVKDNGIGMDKDFLEHLYEPFEREKTSTMSGIQGTGLGMSIVKNLVNMMGGEITVSSKKGVGTECAIDIPLKIAHPDRKDSLVGKEEFVSDSQSRQEGVRVLLVEDNELNSEIASEILEEAGMLVDIAENGQVALDKLIDMKAGYYQLVLMDIQMPVMNGYEATKRIRSLEDEALASIPIVAMTADAFTEDKRHALECGMNAHITKPVIVDELFGLLGEILQT